MDRRINLGGKKMLKIDRVEKEEEIHFILIGELDMCTGQILDDLLQKEELPSGKKIVFSLSQLDFIDSTGIGQLIRYYREYAGQGIAVEVFNENPDIEEVLELIGLRQIIQDN